MSSSPGPIILWCGRFSRSGGYAAVSQNHLRGLIDTGATVAAFDLLSKQLVGPDTGARLHLTAQGDGARIVTEDPGDAIVVVYHERPDLYDRLRSEGRTRLIGHSVFETESLPPGWGRHLASMDEVWAATEFNRVSFARGGVPPFMIHKVPHSIDVDVYDGRLGEMRLADGSTTVLLSVCSALERRDLGLVFRSFLSAFGADDDVCLVVKLRADLATLASAQAQLDQAQLSAGRRAAAVAQKVRLIAADYGFEEMVRLYRGCDVYVSPERAAGWDLPTMEAMASGKLAIAVEASGTTEFCTDEVALRVPAADAMVPMTNDGPHPLYTAQSWPGVDEAHMVEAMRRAVDDHELRREMGERARAHVADRYALAVVGSQILERTRSYRAVDFRSNARATVWFGGRSPVWRQPKTVHDDLVEDLVAGTLLEALAAPARAGEALRLYRRANDLRNTLRSGSQGPLARALGQAVAAPKEQPVRKAAGVSQVAIELARRARSGAARMDLRGIAGAVRDIQGAEYVPGRLPDDADIEARRRAFGRFQVIPLPDADQAALRSLRNRYYGERCFLLGNGPSLNRIDLSRLAGERTFGVNKIFLLYDRIDWRPTFYTLLDWRVGPEIAPHVQELTDSVKFFPNRFRGLLRPDERTYWYTTRPVLDSIDEQFTTDVVAGIPSRGTILVTAIQLAYYLGFRDLILVGVDASYTIPSTVKQSGPDRFGTGTRLNLESTRDDDPNHFDPRYFGAGARWHDPNVDEMVRMFRVMRKGVEINGGSIRNATPGGQLEVFERVDYETLFDPPGAESPTACADASRPDGQRADA